VDVLIVAAVGGVGPAAFPDQHPMAAEGICKAARGLF